MKQYRYQNRLYSIENCTNEDIPSHLEKVLPYYNEYEVETQIERMKDAVYSGTAYKLVDENNNTKIFFYYEQIEEQEVVSIALWYESVRMWIILGMWFRSYTFNQYIYIVPHNMEEIVPFEFIVDTDTIMSYHRDGSALRVNLYSQKCEKLVNIYYRMNVEEL